MSGLHHVATHHSSPHVRKASAAAKAARSAPSASQKILAKVAKPRKSVKEEEEEEIFDFDDGDDMTTSFLQYWYVTLPVYHVRRTGTDNFPSAICEKQILVPNSSILYCSEHCRRMDALPSQNPYASLSLSTSRKYSEQTPTILDPLGLSLPRYIPALQPTPRHHRDSRIPPKQHNGKLDLDPTEWKPAETYSSEDDDHGLRKTKSSGKATVTRPGPQSREPSEALLYLSKYHSANSALPSKSISRQMPATGRTTPSLSHASTTTASSVSSSASNSGSSLADTDSFVSAPPVSVPTTSITGMGSMASGMEALELGDQGLEYEKMTLKKGSKSAARGSLKKLLGSRDGM